MAILAYFVAIWYISPHFGILYQEKSGNPDSIVGSDQCLAYVFGSIAMNDLQRLTIGYIGCLI
jgi:hypothetical protein